MQVREVINENIDHLRYIKENEPKELSKEEIDNLVMIVKKRYLDLENPMVSELDVNTTVCFMTTFSNYSSPKRSIHECKFSTISTVSKQWILKCLCYDYVHERSCCLYFKKR